MKVRIIEDCRDGKKATGQIGEYEGDFNRSVIKVWRDYWTKEKKFAEFDYNWWMTSGWPEHIPEYKGQEPEPDCFWFPRKNPRILLADGSCIWGDECWWEPVVENMPSIEESQKELETTKDFLRAVADTLKK